MSHLIRKPLEPFAVYGYCRGDSRIYTQDDLLGHWSVLFFYPADFTFVCPTELKDLGEHYDAFMDEDCQIFSVSEDTHFVHKAWADASETIRDLPYVMLADPAGKLAREYGVLVEEEGQALPKRPIMPAGWHLMEVKFDEYLPDFIYRSLNLGQLQQTAFSKYYLCRKHALHK